MEYRTLPSAMLRFQCDCCHVEYVEQLASLSTKWQSSNTTRGSLEAWHHSVMPRRSASCPPSPAAAQRTDACSVTAVCVLGGHGQILGSMPSAAAAASGVFWCELLDG